MIFGISVQSPERAHWLNTSMWLGRLGIIIWAEIWIMT